MGKIARFFGISLAIVIILACAAIIGLKVFFPPAKLKALAIEKIEPALGRKLKIGYVSLGLGGVKATGIEVSEIPDFKKGTALKAEEVGVSLRWLPLVQKKVEVSEVLLKKFDIVISASGPSAAASPSSPGAAGAPAASAAFLVGRIRLDGGRVAYKENGKIVHEITRLKADASGLRPKGSWPASVSFDFASGGKKGTLKYKGSIDLAGLDPKKIKIDFKPLSMNYSGIDIELMGSVDSPTAPRIAADFKIGQLTRKELAEFGAGAITQPTALKGRVEAEPAGDSWRVKELSIESSGPMGIQPLPKPMTLKLKLSGMIGKSQAELKKLDLELGKLSLDGSGSLSYAAGKDVSLNLAVQTNTFPIADFVFTDAGVIPQGQASLKARVSGPVAALSLTGEAKISGGKVVYEGQDIQKLDAEARLTPETATFKTTGLWNGASFKLDVSAKDYQKIPVIRLDGTLSELDLAKFDQGSSSSAPAEEDKKQSGKKDAEKSAPLKSSGKIVIGKITHPNFNASQADMEWNLSKGADISKLNGTAKLKIGSGKFDNLKGLGEKSGLVKAMLLPVIVLQKVGTFAKVPLLPAFDKVQFKEITGDYVFENGVMNIKESHMDSSVAFVTATGNADLVRDQIKMRISTKLGAGVGLKLGGPIGFTVTGALSDPSIKPDVASILKQPAVNDAVEQGKKLLEDIFKKR